MVRAFVHCEPNELFLVKASGCMHACARACLFVCKAIVVKKNPLLQTTVRCKEIDLQCQIDRLWMYCTLNKMEYAYNVSSMSQI